MKHAWTFDMRTYVCLDCGKVQIDFNMSTINKSQYAKHVEHGSYLRAETLRRWMTALSQSCTSTCTCACCGVLLDS